MLCGGRGLEQLIWTVDCLAGLVHHLAVYSDVYLQARRGVFLRVEPPTVKLEPEGGRRYNWKKISLEGESFRKNIRVGILCLVARGYIYRKAGRVIYARSQRVADRPYTCSLCSAADDTVAGAPSHSAIVLLSRYEADPVPGNLPTTMTWLQVPGQALFSSSYPLRAARHAAERSPLLRHEVNSTMPNSGDN